MKTAIAQTERRGVAVVAPKNNRPLGSPGNPHLTAGVSVPADMQNHRALRYSLTKQAFDEVESSPAAGVDLRRVVIETANVLVSFDANARAVATIEAAAARFGGYHRSLTHAFSNPAFLADFSDEAALQDMRIRIELFAMCQGMRMARLSVMLNPTDWKRITDLCARLDVPVKKYLRWAASEAARKINERKGGKA